MKSNTAIEFVNNIVYILMLIILLLLSALSLIIINKLNDLHNVLGGEPLSEDTMPLEYAEGLGINDDPIRGDENSPITIIEFGDYECPFSSDVEVVIMKILEEYDGKVRFVFKDYPLEKSHPNAVIAAGAANCAGNQGKYWEMHSLLFSNQGHNNFENLIEYGKSIGLEINQFQDCVSQEKYADGIYEDMKEGDSVQIRGTPLIYINGHRIDDWSLHAFRKIVDSLLEGGGN
jgi:protein-disulfide isomerase